MMKARHLVLFLLLPAALCSLAQSGTAAKHRPKVGLVLGGGGAKGAAEVGALRIIEQSGIPIDYVCGTSIGSIVGGLYAVGYRSADLEQMFLSQEWASLLGDRSDEYRKKFYVKEDGVTYILGFPIGRRGSKLADSSVGALRGDHIVALIDSMVSLKGRRYADSLSFDKLPKPFRCVAVDMNTHEEYVFDRGKLSTALRASMAIPGAFKAVTLNALELVDGGMLNNLPVDVVRAMGADIVIAIDLTQNKHKERDFSLKEKFGIGGLLDWAVSRPDLKKYNQNVADADIYINPDLKGYTPGSFREKAIRDMLQRGEKAAKKKSSELRKLRKKLLGR